MTLGQAAGTAASLALSANVAVRDLAADALRDRLIADGVDLRRTVSAHA
jgi:hypothetical protein